MVATPSVSSISGSSSASVDPDKFVSTNPSASFSSTDIAFLQQQIQNLQSQLNQCQSQDLSQQSSQLVNNAINKLKVQYKNLYSKLKRYKSHIEYFDLCNRLNQKNSKYDYIIDFYLLIQF